MKYIAVWVLGVVLLAVLPIGFGDNVFARYAIGVGVVTAGVIAWAMLGGRGKSEPS
ncbi:MULTISPECIES: hypothetical protein [Burkholderia]|uniref:hypothetical protein n=1 Tax=Burkholderia TaxID=32008 RepID=UPI0012EA037C|nr:MULTISPECIES: hypothetical protein [unclassified Burkholderia]